MNDFFRNAKGEPVLAVGLQAYNSSTGTHMIEKAIHAVKLCGGNTLEAPVYWYAVEPEEGVFDMSLVKNLIDQTRAAGLHLVILWFGASKNSHPNYAPAYIKRAPGTYRLAVGPDGGAMMCVSVHCRATLEKDCRAFCEMMKFLKAYDGEQRTVLAVQIENEMGYSDTDRDYSDIAQADYDKPIPEALKTVTLEDSGIDAPDGSTWRGHFGRHAHEAFSAWYTARYIGEIAAAACKIYDIPYVTNVMVGEMGCEEPGMSYSSGAAVGRVLDIWKKAAPELDLLCPDIYQQPMSEYCRIAERYNRPDNALFVPESPNRGTANAMNMIAAAAKYGAIGVSCFGGEGMLDGNGELLEDSRSIAISMKTIANIAPLLIKYRGTGKIHCFIQEEFAHEQYLKLDNWHCVARFMNATPVGYGLGNTINLKDPANAWHKQERGRGILVQTAENEFYLAGAGLMVEFRRRPDPADPNPFPKLRSRTSTNLNFLTVEEGHFENGTWVVDYIRNGDESNFELYVHDAQLTKLSLPS